MVIRNADKTNNMKKDQKRLRVKQYFIESAKEIIFKEGSEHVTVRRVADLAGYTYPTLYHYFSDQNELLWEVKKVMVQELAEILQKRVGDLSETGIKRIRLIFQIYIAYYFENPNVFKFFYYHPLLNPDNSTDQLKYNLDFEAMWQDTFKELVTTGKLEIKNVMVIAKTIIYAIHGMITLSLSNNGLTQESVFKELDEILDYLLNN